MIQAPNEPPLAAKFGINSFKEVKTTFQILQYGSKSYNTIHIRVIYKLKIKFRHKSGSRVFISTLAVQLIIALFLRQVVYTVHAGKWFHAGILPAELQGTLDRLRVIRVLGHGGERQHVLYLQLASLSTSMSVEIRATFIVTNPVLVHGPVRVVDTYI